MRNRCSDAVGGQTSCGRNYPCAPGSICCWRSSSRSVWPINIARLVLEAGPRVQAEDQSVIRLAREFIETIVAGLNEAPDPDARLNQIVHDLSRLRHVSITRQDDAAGKAADRAGDNGDARSPPAWFVALVHPEKTSVSVPISIHGKPGSLVITSHPDDEMAEIWDGIVTQLEVGSAIAIALFLITMLVVGRALAPLQALSQAMTKIEAGCYDARVEPGGAPELAAICTKLNHLAATLGDAVEDKRRLAERAVSLQDMERKEIARELHDEFGPYLFALRAHAGALMRLSDFHEPDANALRKHGGAILEQVNALQQFNRRILEKLRPVGLAELGLREALGALLRLWGESHPDVAIDTSHFAFARRRRRNRRSDDLPYRPGSPDQRVSPRRRDISQCYHRAGRTADGNAWKPRLRAGAHQRQWPGNDGRITSSGSA